MSARRAFAVLFAGIFGIQLAWVAAVPAYRGPDEFDHVYRAEAVSRADYAPGPTVPAGGRGELTAVRSSVLAAAAPVCADYAYTGQFNCAPYSRESGGWTTALSGAGRYNPLYYATVGSVGRLFEGLDVLYAIRIASAALCAALLAWAGILWRRLGASAWTALGFALALTPILLYSTAIAAPNGIAYAAGVLVWAACLTMLRSPDPPTRGALAAVVVGGVALCNAHATGPMWLLGIAVALFALDHRRFLALLRSKRSRWAIAGVALGAVGAVAWTLTSGANITVGETLYETSPTVGNTVLNELAWVFQAIAAFPARDEMAPVAIYLLWLAPLALILLGALARRPAAGLALGWIALFALASATALTLSRYSSEGYAWQGRYWLPLTVGLVLIPGALAAARRTALDALAPWALAGLPVAMGISVWHVAHQQRDFLLAPWTSAVPAGAVLSGGLAAAGTTVLIITLLRPAERIPG